MALIRVHPVDVLTFKVDDSASAPAASSSASYQAEIVTSATIRIFNAAKKRVLYLLRSTVPCGHISAEPAAGFVGPEEPFVDVVVTLRFPHDVRRLHRESWSVDVVAAEAPADVPAVKTASGEKSAAVHRRSLERQVAAGWRRVRAGDAEVVVLEVRFAWPSFSACADVAKHLSMQLFLLSVQEEAETKNPNQQE